MKNRFYGLKLELEDGIILQSYESAGEVILKAVKEDKKRCVGEEIYEKIEPPLLSGYEWYKSDKGLWISRRKSDGSLIKFIPVKNLGRTGYRHGEYGFKFGLQNWKNSEDFEKKYSDPNTPEFQRVIETIEKLGGFWITCFNLSKSEKDGKFHSVQGEFPHVQMGYSEALKAAASFETQKGLESHLPYGAEYDCMLKWIVRGSKLAYIEVVKDSRRWGHYQALSLAKTGSSEKYNVLGLYDVAGNVSEFTQERSLAHPNKIYARGGDYTSHGEEDPAVVRIAVDSKIIHNQIGMRAVVLPKN